MSWARVVLSVNGVRYGTRPDDPLEMSEEDFVLKDDVFLAFAIRRSDGRVSHYVWNPRHQPLESWMAAANDLIARIPRPAKRLFVSGLLRSVGMRVGGPVAAVGLMGFAQFPFHKLWSKLSDSQSHAPGYYEAESGDLSTTFRSPLRLSDVMLVTE